ncbi:MAG: hypothetical protein BGO21_30585 [Dyadobacter sp. 50-39]|uniref:capsule assembly Wzi family protein n=1 Tax=Dyadobacter sp. 50-39 TaxID=1895756 RepID=UPI0009606BA9|nr:capsule assembly Wzi family protein [Dyadobacter sp. 50-39]OJV15920.1 MAG: hypothetical protein BGO21_30585 [Dyadobacter sp. 50-39]
MIQIYTSSEAFPTRCTKLFYIVLVVIAVGLLHPVAGQDTSSAAGHTQAWVEVAGYGSTSSRTPFWFHANQWGVVSMTGQAGSLRAGITGRQPFSRDTLAKKNWTYVYGVEVVGNVSKHSKVLLPQAYAGIDFKGFQFTVGRFKQYAGFNDDELGSGAYMWSGNALPIPKIQLGFAEYKPLIKNFLYFKGFYSDGIFENSRPITSHLKLHNKALFVRLGRPSGKVKLYGGFNHAVQWGGKSPYFTENGQMPNGLGYYWYVITGLKPKNKTELSNFDRTNRIGNHVASLDAGIEFDLPNVNIFLYRQNLVEDGSLFYLNNIKDGLNGLVFNFKHTEPASFSLDKLTLELLYTKSQGGTETTNANGIRGKDDYFNNGQVRDGWSYFGRGIGTPFITAATENNWPLYADFFTNNNRVWVTHLGMKGSLQRIHWKTKLSFSSNQGTYDQPFRETVYQFSGLLALAKQTSFLGGSTVQVALSVDRGKLFDPAAGLMLSIRKDFHFKVSR